MDFMRTVRYTLWTVEEIGKKTLLGFQKRPYIINQKKKEVWEDL
jgi:hypothetical protein